ncbi:MAG: ABC transporter substrate-binding protein [Ktedonobacteraceae bacterium]|nr:ABC transporter substrate-binding protein [Ktedonobacteraceae bacterium]
MAQHEFNNGNHGFRIRILIANSGTDINNVTAIAQQIVNIANQDKTVVGVISWLSSAENITALSILAAAHISMISPSASSDTLTNSSPFFFRIVPPNKVQGKESALFAEHALHAQKVVVFIDNNDPYSQNLAQNFEKQFRQDGKTILKEEPFMTDQTTKIGNLIQDALQTKPDLLYFTNRDTSDVAHFQDALPTTGPFAQLPVLSSDEGGYVLRKAGQDRWYFASFAFANVVDKLTGSTPLFYQDYSDAFNSDGLKKPGFYGYTRPNDISMLSYDVTSVFLKATQQVIDKNKIALTSAGLRRVTPDLLASTLPAISFSGVSGLIAFDSDHNPVNKAIIFLAVSASGIYMKDWRGCFTKDICHT